MQTFIGQVTLFPSYPPTPNPIYIKRSTGPCFARKDESQRAVADADAWGESVFECEYNAQTSVQRTGVCTFADAR